MISPTPLRRAGRQALLPAAVAAASLAALHVSRAGAHDHGAVACGATITHSTTLTADLLDCPGVGLRIGADGVVLDLGGHTVAASAARNPRAHGILVVGHDRVVIRNGRVRGFGAYGVRLAGVDRSVVRDLRLVDNTTGIGLVESDANLVQRLQASGSRFVGVNLSGGRDNLVRRNAISD